MMKKKIALALLVSTSLQASAHVRPRPHKHFDVCFVEASSKSLSYQTNDVESFLNEGKSVCSVFIKQKDRTQAEERVLLVEALNFFRQGEPSIIYIPEEYESFFMEYAPELKEHFKVVRSRDKQMSDLLIRLVRDFNTDFSTFYLFYDQSMTERKRIWESRLKEAKLPVKAIKLSSKKNLVATLKKLNQDNSRGIIINLLNEIRDTEYDTQLDYDAIKRELLSRNRKHLTVGVEKTRRYNEALVLLHSDRDSRTDILLNKRVFDRLRMEKLYLDNSWELVGGFLSERESL